VSILKAVKRPEEHVMERPDYIEDHREVIA
jgi:hypothetical protein